MSDQDLRRGPPPAHGHIQPNFTAAQEGQRQGTSPHFEMSKVTENPMLPKSSQQEVRGNFHADRADEGQSALANIEPFQMYELRKSSIPNLPAPPQPIEEAKYFTQRDRDGHWATNPGSLEKQGKSSIKMPTDKAEVKSCFTFDCCSGILWTWKFEHPRAAMLRNLRLDEKPEKEDEEEKEKEKEKEKEIGKKDLETSLSRAGRVDSFQRASDNAIGPPFAHSTVTKPISSTLATDEEIIASVHVSAIDGLPSATNDVQVEGSIEIALVRSKSGSGDMTAAASSASDKARMVFSVTAGTATISVREEFAASRLEAKGGLCACCFPTSCLNCCCPCYMTGNFFYDYQAQHSLTSQFFLLPVAPCVIDITAHSHSSKEFAALAESRKSDDDECRIPCCDCFACCACCCSCCQCCTKCSQFDYYSAFSGTSTSATCVDPIPQPRSADPVIRGVEWHVESRGDDGIFLVLHYKHHLSNNLRSCVMKLRKGSSFDEAKLFVAAVHKHTVPFPHDAMDVLAPAGLQPAEWTLVESFGPDGRLIRGAPKTDSSVMPGCLEGCAEVLYSLGYHSLFCCFFYPCCPLIPRALPYGLGICALARILRKRAAQNKMAGVGAKGL